MHKDKRRQEISVLFTCCCGTLLQKDSLLIRLLQFSSNSGPCTLDGTRLADRAILLNYMNFRAKNAMPRTGGKFSISSTVFSWHKATVAMKYFYMFKVIMRCSLLRSLHTCDSVSRTGVRGNLINLCKQSGIFHLNLNARLLYSISFGFHTPLIHRLLVCNQL